MRRTGRWRRGQTERRARRPALKIRIHRRRASRVRVDSVRDGCARRLGGALEAERGMSGRPMGDRGRRGRGRLRPPSVPNRENERRAERRKEGRRGPDGRCIQHPAPRPFRGPESGDGEESSEQHPHGYRPPGTSRHGASVPRRARPREEPPAWCRPAGGRAGRECAACFRAPTQPPMGGPARSRLLRRAPSSREALHAPELACCQAGADQSIYGSIYEGLPPPKSMRWERVWRTLLYCSPGQTRVRPRGSSASPHEPETPSPRLRQSIRAPRLTPPNGGAESQTPALRPPTRPSAIDNPQSAPTDRPTHYSSGEDESDDSPAVPDEVESAADHVLLRRSMSGRMRLASTATRESVLPEAATIR